MDSKGNSAKTKRKAYRKNKRIPVVREKQGPTNSVSFHASHERKEYKGSILSLSQNGLFVKSRHIPERGSFIFLSFYFCNKSIKCMGKVAYVNQEDIATQPKGFGVRFTQLVQEDEQSILNAVEEYQEVESPPTPPECH